MSLCLPNGCTAFQAEIYEINVAAKIISTSTINIYVYSLAAIKTMNSNIVK